MSQVNVNVNEAIVAAVKEFNTFKGYGVDFYVQAHSSSGTVILQVVLYDNEARSYCQNIHVGDTVSITGNLKVKIYRKADGAEGFSLVIEKPVSFTRIASGSSKQLLQTSETDNKEKSEAEEEVTITARTACENIKDDNTWDSANQADAMSIQPYSYPDEDEFETPY